MDVRILLRVLSRPARKELFIDENLQKHDKESIVPLIKQRKINNLFLAKRNGKEYIKSKPNAKAADNIACKSISQTELISFYKGYIKAIANQKIKAYDDIRRKRQKKNYIIIRDDRGDFVSTKTEDDISAHLKKHKSIILKAALEQKIDPLLLGAILTDEYCRTGWDDWLDWLGALNIKDTSVGIAQIKLGTAREIIRKKYYNPAPGKITEKSPPAQVWFYLYQPEHSIRFSAAAIRLSIEYWKNKKVDISKQNKVLAYLYSAGHTKDVKKSITKRCLQISGEFYQMAKSILL